MFEGDHTEPHSTEAGARMDQYADLVAAVHAICRLRTSEQLLHVLSQTQMLLVNRLVAERLNARDGQ